MTGVDELAPFRAGSHIFPFLLMSDTGEEASPRSPRSPCSLLSTTIVFLRAGDILRLLLNENAFTTWMCLLKSATKLTFVVFLGLSHSRVFHHHHHQNSMLTARKWKMEVDLIHYQPHSSFSSLCYLITSSWNVQQLKCLLKIYTITPFHWKAMCFNLEPTNVS